MSIEELKVTNTPSKTITSLKALLKKDAIIEEEFPDKDLKGFKVRLKYVSRDQILKLQEKCTTTKFDRKSRQVIQDIDSDIFQELFVKEVIVGWVGLKYKYLQSLMVVDLSEYEDLDLELSYTPELAFDLIRNSSIFDSWINEIVSNVENFNKS